MITKRMLVMGTDQYYYDYTVIAIRSFLSRNPGWSTLVMDVGMTPAQVRSLRQIALVVNYPREEFRGPGRYIPSAKARCLALAQFPDAETLMLYLDGDTVTLGPVEPMVEEFLASGRPIGIGCEDDRRFFAAPVSRSWAGGEVPLEFPNRERWRHQKVLNTGVLLATGAAAAEVGRLASEWYEKLKDRYLYGEQTIINAVIYEHEVECFSLSASQHCFLHERYLSSTGRPYIDPVYLDGNKVLIRHFCHRNKNKLEELMPCLMAYYGLPECEESAPTGGPAMPVPVPTRRLHRGNPLRLPKPNDYYGSSRSGVVSWVMDRGISARRVLEIGCSAGNASLALKRALGTDYYAGIERDVVAAAAARAKIDEVFVVDLERLGFKDVALREGDFDLLVALDVLEHVQDPWDLLADLMRFLRPGGGLLLSIPNVQNIAVLEGLARGEWRYQSSGLLDATHLRFFTWNGVKSLLEGAGLRIKASQPLFRPPLKVDELPEKDITLVSGDLSLNNLTKQQTVRMHTWQFFVYATLA